MLIVENVDVVYSDVILALTGVSLKVPDGAIVAVLGSNGAGKTTLLKAVSGLLAAEDGRVVRGTIQWDGEEIQGKDPATIYRKGIVQVLEGRRVFEHLSVLQNLVLGAHLRSDRKQVSADLERVLEYFPRLRPLLKRTAGFLSGGEQQMLVIGRALMARPRLLMLDEPSLGLAPLIVEEIAGILRLLNEKEGVSILLVEQNVRVALSLAGYGYVLENGRVVLDGPATQLRENEDVKEFYLGLTIAGARKSYRQAKHYKRRKRWLG